MNQNSDVTTDILQYQQCLLPVWQSFCRQYDVESNWDLCDLFADVGSDIFEIYAGKRLHIAGDGKAKQSNTTERRNPSNVCKSSRSAAG